MLRLTDRSASGLGRATVADLHSRGAYVAILDLNEDNGAETIKELGGDTRAKFWECDVSDSGSVEAAVKGVLGWVSSSGKEIGGVVAAAGVGFPGKVRPFHQENAIAFASEAETVTL